jgi:hypothetical protein
LVSKTKKQHVGAIFINVVDPKILDSKPFITFFGELDKIISHFENKPNYKDFTIKAVLERTA